MSDESNVITVDPAGVNGIEATEPLAVLPIGNGIYFRCAVAHTNVRIIDITGRVIKVIDSVSEGHCELLLTVPTWSTATNAAVLSRCLSKTKRQRHDISTKSNPALLLTMRDYFL